MASLPLEPASIAVAAQRAVAALLALPDGDDYGAAAQEYIDESGRLGIWIAEHEARSGKLDHKLREASHLRDRVLSLLTKLSDVARAPLSAEELVDNLQPVERSSHEHNLDVGRHDVVETVDSNSLSIESNVTLQESAHYSVWEQVHDIVALLFDLGPALHDPSPLNRFEQSTRAEASQPALKDDISHVRSLFPNAVGGLVYRLGRANWERRQTLASVQRSLAAILGDAPRPPATGLSAKDPATDDSESEGSSVSVPYSRVPYGAGEVSTATSESRSPNLTRLSSESGLSAIASQYTAPTEVSKAFPRLETNAVNVPKPYKFPSPPPSHRLFPREDFTCSYCAHVVSGLQTMSDWRKHVLEDLQPYMCTYTDCLLSAKTYGRKTDWWTHEVERHRTRRSWVCPPCEQEGDGTSHFVDLESFEKHIHENHPIKLPPTQIRSISDMCQRNVESEPPPSECPLCREEIAPTSRNVAKAREESAKRHIATHMEQLALLVAFPERRSDFGEGNPGFLQDDSDAPDDAQDEIYDIEMSHDFHVSKQQMTSAVVNDFLADQQREILGLAADQTESSPAMVPVSGSANRKPQKDTRPATKILSKLVGMPPRNEHFYCRQSLLTDMNKVLRLSGSICYTYGAGGVGKTLAAVEYSYQHQEDYDALFWLQADTAPGLVDSYFQMATALGIAENPADHDHFIGRAREWLETTSTRWLLVFDNVIQWAHIARYMPNHMSQTKGSVLILTQNHNLPLTSRNVSKLRVAPLSQNDGAEMLLQYLGRDPKLDVERKLASEISALCGGFPVAIAQAAGYVSYEKCTLEELFDTFREWRRRTGMATDEADDLPPAFREASFKYEDMLEMVWEITLRELSQDARDVLNILAYLNSASVPQKMVWRVHENPILQCLDRREKHRMRKIHESLTQRRLILEADENYAMHRSLSRGIRTNLAKDPVKQQMVFDQAVALVRETFPRGDELQQPRPDQWAVYQKLVPHLHALHLIYRVSKPWIKGSADFVQLLMDAGLDQSERMFHNEGLTLLHTAEIALEDSLEPLSEDTQMMKAGIHALIALMYDDAGIGKRQEALNRRKEALRLRHSMFQASATKMRTDEILLFNSEMDYVVSLLSYSRYEEAEPIMEKCLAKYEEWGSEDSIPFEYAKYYHNKAFVKLHQLNFEDAIHMAEKAISLMQHRGLEISASRFRFDLACIVIQSGDLERALHELQEIYDEWLRSLGPTNQLCLYSMYAIGATNELMGNLPEAEKWFRRTLQVRRSTTSWPEEAYARAQYHLAQTLLAQGESEEVHDLLEQAMAVLHRLLPRSERPPELVDVTNDAILFDYMLPTGPRYLGRGLLERFVYAAS